MERVAINNTEYEFISDFKKNDEIRNSFNKLAENTFEFNFENFHLGGYWNERYVPYALLDRNEVVSNVAINILEFSVLGESKLYIQIGTVMTAKEYRNKGLSRFLLQKIIDEWQNKCDMIYLFANDTVLDFYPKFGFCEKMEYQYSKDISSDREHTSAVKLDMSDNENRQMLFDICDQTNGFSKIYARHNTALVMFYATSFMSQNVYYIKEYETVLFAEYKKDTLYLNDVFCKRDISLTDIIDAVTNKDITKIVLGFTPLDIDSYDVELFEERDNTLFVRIEVESVFDKNKLMLPILSHA